jgi:hypothetical protein
MVKIQGGGRIDANGPNCAMPEFESRLIVTAVNLNPAVKTTTKHAKFAKGIDHQDIAGKV